MRKENYQAKHSRGSSPLHEAGHGSDDYGKGLRSMDQPTDEVTKPQTGTGDGKTRKRKLAAHIKEVIRWYKINLTDKQLSKYEDEKLVAAFQKVYDRCKSQVVNMALFGAKDNNCTYYLNASASSCCGEIIEQYAAEITTPIKHVHRIAGEVGPQIFES